MSNLTPKFKLDNTKRSTFVRCKRLYYWEHIRYLQPFYGSTALRYGITWHAGLEAFYLYVLQYNWQHDGKALENAILAMKKTFQEETINKEFYDDYRTLENCITSLLTYLNHFSYDEHSFIIKSVENVFQIKMEPKENEGNVFPYIPLEGLYFTGKLDLTAEIDGAIWPIEHKTTGQSISMQKQRLQRNPQCLGYAYASQKMHSSLFEGILINLHQLNAYKSKKTGTYGNPKIDFARIPQIYTSEDLEAWRISFLSTANEIFLETERNLWPMQEDSCYQYGRCKFTALCEQNTPLGEENIDNFYIGEPFDVTTHVEKEEIITFN